jgi:hypothetical protein
MSGSSCALKVAQVHPAASKAMSNRFDMMLSPKAIRRGKSGWLQEIFSLEIFVTFIDLVP